MPAVDVLLRVQCCLAGRWELGPPRCGRAEGRTPNCLLAGGLSEPRGGEWVCGVAIQAPHFTLQSTLGSLGKWQTQVPGRVVTSFNAPRAGLEPGVGCSPEDKAQQIRTSGSGPLCDWTHLESVGQPVAFIQSIRCLEQSGHCWIFSLKLQER